MTVTELIDRLQDIGQHTQGFLNLTICDEAGAPITGFCYGEGMVEFYTDTDEEESQPQEPKSGGEK